MTGSLMAFYANAHKEEDTPAFKRSDFFKLSYDKEEDKKTKPKLTLKEAKGLMGSKFNYNGK